jgi:hypothetical protein
MIRFSDDIERGRWFGPTRLIARGVFGHTTGTVTAERDNQQVIDILHDLSQLPMEPFEHLHIKSASKNAILQANAIRFQRFGYAPQPLGIANIVAHEVPLFGSHDFTSIAI